jgi:hypothetical protein
VQLRPWRLTILAVTALVTVGTSCGDSSGSTGEATLTPFPASVAGQTVTTNTVVKAGSSSVWKISIFVADRSKADEVLDELVHTIHSNLRSHFSGRYVDLPPNEASACSDASDRHEDVGIWVAFDGQNNPIISALTCSQSGLAGPSVEASVPPA